MSLNAAAILVMADKGLSAFDIAEVAAACERRADPKAADRMAKMRARKKAESDGVTPVTVTGEPLNDIILNPTLSPIVSDETIAPEPEIGLKPEHVVEAWNALAERKGLKAVRRLSPDRRRKLKTRIGQNPIEDFTEAIAAVDRSPFLCGENDRGWKAYFDWMLEPKNFTKLIEGTYDR